MIRRVPFLMLAVVLVACSQAGAPTSTPAAESSVEATDAATAEPTESPSRTPRPSPTPVPIETREVEWTVPFSMDMPADWAREGGTGTSVFFSAGRPDRWIEFTLAGPDTVDGWIDSMATQPRLIITEPTPIELGGAAGMAVDARVSDQASGNCSAGPNVRCFTLFQNPGAGVWEVVENQPSRVWVVDVDGEVVLIVTDAQERSFDAWIAVVEPLLQTLTWNP
jgi:hypothetical protein